MKRGWFVAFAAGAGWVVSGTLGMPAWAAPASEPVPSIAPLPLVTVPASVPGPMEGLIDVAVPTLTSAGLLYLTVNTGLAGWLGAGGVFGQVAVLGGVTTVPPAALVAVRGGRFAADGFFAAYSGGVVGLVGGLLAARALTGAPIGLASDVDPGQMAWRVGLMAVGQGLGTAAGFHLYRGFKGTAVDLDRLPAKRVDDPIEDWKIWRERRNP